MDAWWLNVIGAVLISGCVQNMDAHGINVSKSLAKPRRAALIQGTRKEKEPYRRLL